MEARVTAVRLYWVELDVCSLVGAADGSCSMPHVEAVAGMKATIAAPEHLSSAPIDDLSSVLQPGDMVKVGARAHGARNGRCPPWSHHHC